MSTLNLINKIVESDEVSSKIFIDSLIIPIYKRGDKKLQKATNQLITVSLSLHFSEPIPSKAAFGFVPIPCKHKHSNIIYQIFALKFS